MLCGGCWVMVYVCGVKLKKQSMKTFKIFDLGSDNDRELGAYEVDADSAESALYDLLNSCDVDHIDGYRFRVECEGEEPFFLESFLEIKIRRFEP